MIGLSGGNFTYIVLLVIWNLIGVFQLVAGIFLVKSYSKILKSEKPREKDMLFELVQKLDYLLKSRKWNKTFIEDKKELSESAKKSGKSGIFIGAIMLVTGVFLILDFIF